MFTFLKKLSIIILVKFMEKKKDLRIIKTQNLLYASLIKLMKDKSFEEIKVADICNEAYINRSTFYSHYNDKYELLVDFVNELKNNLLNSLEKNENLSIYIKGDEKYIEAQNEKINEISTDKSNIAITDCYNFYEIADKSKDIIRKYDNQKITNKF